MIPFLFLTLIQFVFLILFVRQIIIVFIAMWTGYFSDVPFESTKKSALKKLLKEIHPKNNQMIYDLGSGSGRVAFFLAQNTKAQIMGVEKNAPLFLLSKFKHLFLPQLKNLEFIHQDLFEINLKNANIIYTYFSPAAYKKAASKFETELKKDTLFIAWRYPFKNPSFKLKKKIESGHTMYIYQKTS